MPVFFNLFLWILVIYTNIIDRLVRVFLGATEHNFTDELTTFITSSKYVSTLPSKVENIKLVDCLLHCALSKQLFSTFAE